ncbi:hypothetical protein CGLY_16580 (plasmid) [Corynebacterium glyciniphilum AJ 3170]|uniref:YcfA family protein n=1 Tax=Corynebacterium glyciniphilum AJ 3170 TaxID=1404245 RepID=X5DWK6_9CORY|nr:hypothetical protein [Corynebacterium glyciniphilum]AHW65689.1 hypothetical protein CGLY_16580 [Corynebacterium glyciniphilum AJ 3170]
MTKRQKLLRDIRRQAKKTGVSYRESEGDRHTIVHLGTGRPVPIPRHNEIPERTTEAIYKETEEYLGKRWWKQ